MPAQKLVRQALNYAHARTLRTMGKVSSVIDPQQGNIEVTHFNPTLPRLAHVFHGYRIVQISDIHKDADMPGEYIISMVELVNRQQPDMIAITGDFVTGEPERQADVLIATLSNLQANDIKVAVSGNHDHHPWSSPNVIRHICEQSDITLLNNRFCSIEEEDDAILYVAGVDDVCRGMNDLDHVLAILPDDDAPAILLCHEPDFADVSAQTKRFALQLSGHSHGGQVSLPMLGAPVLPKYARKYPTGHYTVQGMHLYTNRGLAHPHVRYNCRPEITVITLHADGSEAV